MSSTKVQIYFTFTNAIEIINIFTHGKEITEDVKNFLKYWKEQKYELAGVAMGKIAGILLEPEAK
jgi:hypothetical protein